MLIIVAIIVILVFIISRNNTKHKPPQFYEPINTPTSPQLKNTVTTSKQNDQSAGRFVPRLKTPGTSLSHISADEFDAELSAIPLISISRSDCPVSRQPIENMPEIKYSNITRQTNKNNLFPLVVLDTETTGVNPAKDEIVELSAIRFENWFKPTACFSTLLKPHGRIPLSATNVNHITNEMVEGFPSFQEVCSSFCGFIKDCNIVGHNLPFDLECLYTNGMSIPERVRFYDTLTLSRRVLISPHRRLYDHHTGHAVPIEESGIHVDDFKLVTLCEYYGIQRSTAHRALSDCLATAKVFEWIMYDKTLPIENTESVGS